MMDGFRTAPPPQHLIIGTFVFLLAIVFAVAPAPIIVRSLAIVACCYLAFSAAGMPFAYLVALVAPPVGLLSGDGDWLVMLPIMLASGLLAMLALEFSWRYPAIILSPLLYVMPPLFVTVASRQALFAVELPWEGAAMIWTLLHGLIALAGMLFAVTIDRRRENRPHDDNATRAVSRAGR